MADVEKNGDQPEEQLDGELRPQMAKLVQAIAKKRKDLGLLEWGPLPIEEVVAKLTEPTEEAKEQKKNVKPAIFETPPDDGSDIPPIV